MTRLRLFGALLCGFSLCAWLSACDACSREKRLAIATMSTLVGSGVSRDYAEKPRDWVAAELGAELALGDGARTDEKSTAELTFINGATLELRPKTTIRLLVDGQSDETGIDVQAGEAELRAKRGPLTLRTHVGVATLAPDSEITLTREGEELEVHVALGSVTFRDRDAGEIGLSTGERMRIGIGMAVLSRSEREVTPIVPEGSLLVMLERGGARVKIPGQGIRTLAARDVLPKGSELKLEDGAEVVIAQGASRVRARGGELTLGGDGVLLESRRGSVQFELVEQEIAVRVPGGSMTAHPSAEGTRANVTVSSDDTQIAVERGTVTANVHGKAEELAAGDTRTYLHREVAAEPGPSYFNVTAPIGESFIVHAPSAPVAVGFQFGKRCPREGLLEQVGGRQLSRGAGSANLAFVPGVRGYTLRCIDEHGAPGRIVARGSVQVVVDPGTRKLPPKAPTSQVEADGRTYTIYYQNQLPEVAVRWPNAPSVPKYTLDLDGTTIELGEPLHVFRSGALADGVHRLSFQAGGRRSRTTTVEVRFDNAAPKASLTAPEDRSFAPGDLVTVEGVALPTWKVTLEGGTIAMHPGDRFTGQVQTSKEHPDIAVRLSHPRLGTHYYLRRASDSP